VGQATQSRFATDQLEAQYQLLDAAGRKEAHKLEAKFRKHGSSMCAAQEGIMPVEKVSLF
jgi:hypothetical protein